MGIDDFCAKCELGVAPMRGEDKLAQFVFRQDVAVSDYNTTWM
jgi:hypothetical protein